MEKLHPQQWNLRFGIRTGPEITRILSQFQGRALKLGPPVPDLEERLRRHLSLLGVDCGTVSVIPVSITNGSVDQLLACLPKHLRPAIEDEITALIARALHPLGDSLRQSIKKSLEADYNDAYALVANERHSFFGTVERSLDGGLLSLEKKIRDSLSRTRFGERPEMSVVATNLWTSLLYQVVLTAAEYEDQAAKVAFFTDLFRQGNYIYGEVAIGANGDQATCYPVLVE